MATRINLLDWRAARRARRRKEFLTMLGLGLGAGVALLGLGYVTMTGAVDHQNQRNAYLTAQIRDLDKQIKEIEELEKVKANLVSRMNVIQQLQESRSATVHFFDEIVNTLPDGVNLESIKQSGQNVTIEGTAESSGRISAYIKNLDASPWFRNPKLVVIKTGEKNKQRNSEFTLQVTNLTKATADGDGGSAGGAP
ncbi:MAG: PilN domain-containing protein [Gammaproteobacteria bacterium]|uniref:PilN domain-containing protein n=1 Tax=Nevskia sp. TaxID=1929292 RepID=UPI0040354148|nr:PilN domain-containing protein [Gammaproteobacteria bacterium]